MAANSQVGNLSYFTKVMIEDNNHIISTNAVKILTYLIKSQSPLLPQSFPLLFVFQKFRLHKTHPVNATLLTLVDAAIISPRSNDLFSAVIEGMCSSSAKANIKYGCIVTYIRIVSYYFADRELF